MGHHGYSEFQGDFINPNQINESINENKINRDHHIKEVNDQAKLGATGNFPDGKIDKTDEGEIRFAVAKIRDQIIINMGEKPVSWVGLTIEQAVDLAKILCKNAGVVMTIEIPA